MAKVNAGGKALWEHVSRVENRGIKGSLVLWETSVSLSSTKLTFHVLYLHKGEVGNLKKIIHTVPVFWGNIMYGGEKKQLNLKALFWKILINDIVQILQWCQEMLPLAVGLHVLSTLNQWQQKNPAVKMSAPAYSGKQSKKTKQSINQEKGKQSDGIFKISSVSNIFCIRKSL